MRHVLSLDLGLTTGWALLDRTAAAETPYDYSKALVAHGTIDEVEYERELKFLLLKYTPRWSVAEKPVIFRGQLGDHLERIVQSTRVILDHQVVEITAPEWKNSPYRTYPCPRGISAHERDAIRFGAWYCNQLENIVEGPEDTD